MSTDEQAATAIDPLGAFLISEIRPRSVSARPVGLEEYLAALPLSGESRPMGDDGAETPRGAVSSSVANSGAAHRETRPRLSMDEERNAVAAIIADLPRVEAERPEPPPAPRTLVAETAALAAAEPRALVAPGDVLGEAPDRAQEADHRQGEQDAALLGALLEDGGLVGPLPWFSIGAETDPRRDSFELGAGGRFPSSEAPALAMSPLSFDQGRWAAGSPRASGSIPSVDRFDESSSETIEEIEGRLSLIAARLEGAVERIESTASTSSLSGRAGGFRGRVDE